MRVTGDVMFLDSSRRYTTPSVYVRKEAWNMQEQHDDPPCRGHSGEPWRPALHQRYYVILGHGRIQALPWAGTPFDYEAWQFGNCFRTHREAERAREALRHVLRSLHADSRR